MENKSMEFVQKPLPESVLKTGIILLIAGVVIGVIGLLLDFDRMIFSYLVAFVFVTTVSLGALFMVSLEYITNAIWSVPIRRIMEFLASALPIIMVLSVPILLSMHSLFHWTHTEAVANDPLLAGKEPYLNNTFFIIRVIVVFAVWSLYYFMVTGNSRKQDLTKDQKLSHRNLVFSAAFIPLFAITISIFAVDFLMSLEPHWFSTIFGIYVFSGTVLAGLASVTIIIVMMMEKGYAHPALRNDHLFSLGALLFGFVNFWAYIAFSQYMLIWYANLPEETFWFLARWEGYWVVISLLLIIVHFIVPYIVLLPQPAKMDPKRLKFISIWILFAHLLDIYWLAMPQMHSDKSGFYAIFEIGFPIAAVGLMIVVFAMNYKKFNIIPVGDPKLQRGINFRI